MFWATASLPLLDCFVFNCFLLRNNIILIFSSPKLQRFCDTGSLALENSLSEGTNVAGMHRNLFAQSCSLGKSGLCNFHQFNGSISHEISDSSRYRTSSPQCEALSRKCGKPSYFSLLFPQNVSTQMISYGELM